MPIDDKLLAILCCPESKQPLAIADGSLIATLNSQIREKNLKNVAGKPVSELLDAGLIREDKKILYPVRKEIPILLKEEGIAL